MNKLRIYKDTEIDISDASIDVLAPSNLLFTWVTGNNVLVNNVSGEDCVITSGREEAIGDLPYTLSNGSSVEFYYDYGYKIMKPNELLSSQLNNVAKADTTKDGWIIQDFNASNGMHIGSLAIWKTMPYNRKYGFGGYPYGTGVLPPFSRIAGVFEADMLSARGGKGRWNGLDTTNFKHGGHVFEGWNREEDTRITAGIGLNHKDIAWIQTFHPATEDGGDGGAYYGITKIGSDLDGEGCNFMPDVTNVQSPLVFWNRPTTFVPVIATEQLDLLISTGEIPASIVNYTDGMIYGGSYYDNTLKKVRVYTDSGWKSLAFEV